MKLLILTIFLSLSVFVQAQTPTGKFDTIPVKIMYSTGGGVYVVMVTDGFLVRELNKMNADELRFLPTSTYLWPDRKTTFDKYTVWQWLPVKKEVK